MGALADLKTISHLLVAKKSGNTHAERLESFYSTQAEDYDAFRKKLLHGREALVAKLDFPKDATVVDIGGGTGNNLDALGPHQRELITRWDLIDLCPSLLAVAKNKIATQHLRFAQTHEADACNWQSNSEVDVVLFSYSATMIPDWISAFENAYDMLKPGGRIAIVDFFVCRKHGTAGVKHSTFTRHFWPLWFAWDNVFISQDHVPWLQSRFQTEHLMMASAPLPYLPFTRVPYYSFIGRKL